MISELQQVLAAGWLPEDSDIDDISVEQFLEHDDLCTQVQRR